MKQLLILGKKNLSDLLLIGQTLIGAIGGIIKHFKAKQKPQNEKSA